MALEHMAFQVTDVPRAVALHTNTLHFKMGVGASATIPTPLHKLRTQRLRILNVDQISLEERGLTLSLRARHQQRSRLQRRQLTS